VTGTRFETRRNGARGWARWLLFVLLVAAQSWALYAPHIGGPALFAGSDKVVHVALFLVVTFAGLRAGIPARWLAGVLIGEAIVSEVVQGLALSGRDGDVFDVLADVVGVGLGLLADRAVPVLSGPR
jgi:hypothetical protein